jgi:hypothetical protein
MTSHSGAGREGRHTGVDERQVVTLAWKEGRSSHWCEGKEDRHTGVGKRKVVTLG